MSDDLLARVATWLSSGDTGSSSKAICSHMSGGTVPDPLSYPRDGADLARCLRLLKLFPEWEPRISEMAKYGAGWAGLVAAWPAVIAAADDGRRVYALMQKAIADGFRADPNYECSFGKDGTLYSWTKKGGGPRGITLRPGLSMSFGR